MRRWIGGFSIDRNGESPVDTPPMEEKRRRREGEGSFLGKVYTVHALFFQQHPVSHTSYTPTPLLGASQRRPQLCDVDDWAAADCVRVSVKCLAWGQRSSRCLWGFIQVLHSVLPRQSGDLMQQSQCCKSTVSSTARVATLKITFPHIVSFRLEAAFLNVHLLNETIRFPRGFAVILWRSWNVLTVSDVPDADLLLPLQHSLSPRLI